MLQGDSTESESGAEQRSYGGKSDDNKPMYRNLCR